MSSKKPISPLARLRGLFHPDRTDIMAVVVFAMAIGGLLLATPIAVQSLVNFVGFGGATAPILVLAFLLACGLGLAALLTAVQTWIVEIIQRRLFVRMVAQFVHRLPRANHKALEDRYGPELVNRFFDVMTVQKTAAFLLLDGLGVILGVVIGMLVLAFYHPLLLALDLVLLVAVAFVVFGLGRVGVQTAINESKAKYAVAAWLEEIARHPTTFKEPSADDYLLRRADSVARDYLTSRKAHYGILFRQIIGALALQVAASVALLGLGGLLVVHGELTLGQLVAAELIVSYVVGSIAKMGKHLEAFYDLMGAADKLGELLDLPLETPGVEEWTTEPGARGSSVVARDLVCYVPSTQRLHAGVSFEVQPGTHVAIAGLSAARKTALLETIFGLWGPVSGTLVIDGLDVRGVQLDALRQRVAMAGVSDLFAGSVRDNVTLGFRVSAENLQESLRAVGLLDDLLALPRGLDTIVTGSGAPLSRRQQALLGLARALCRRPALLMVDGILDLLSDAEVGRVMKSLTDPGACWTLLIITDQPDRLPQQVRVIDLSGDHPSTEVVP